MKRAIDVKSLVIGVLATALFFTIIVIVAKSRNDANVDTITAKTIKIVNPEGKTVVSLRSVKGTGMLGIYNKKGKVVVGLGSLEGAGNLSIHNKEGKCVADLASVGEEGILDIYNKEGTPVAVLASNPEGGVLDIYNKHGNRVATVQANKDSVGIIYISDRYGDPGWAMTGKR
ncbi:MAG: hypothetical protein U9N18_05465 [Campylobacterota bacterium]|nr:hypothetical protein [Campylobacterota bacterium]